MAIQASPEAIREMAQDIRSTITDIEHISEGIRSGIRSTESWDDAKAAQFNEVMQRIARLTESPVSDLNAAIPKLENLAQILDSYNGKSIG